MNFGQMLAYVVMDRILTGGGGTLRWKTVQQWINEHASRSNINQGYASFNPRTGSAVGNSFVELQKEPVGSKSFRVIATLYFNKRQGPFATKTWEVTKLDSELQKMFGKNLSTRISI